MAKRQYAEKTTRFDRIRRKQQREKNRKNWERDEILSLFEWVR